MSAIAREMLITPDIDSYTSAVTAALREHELNDPVRVEDAVRYRAALDDITRLDPHDGEACIAAACAALGRTTVNCPACADAGGLGIKVLHEPGRHVVDREGDVSPARSQTAQGRSKPWPPWLWYLYTRFTR